MSPDPQSLQRELHPMPEFVRVALEASGLMDAYHARPRYQQNDYLGWISSGKLEATQQKRLAQMLEELSRGGVYMRMPWSPKR